MSQQWGIYTNTRLLENRAEDSSSIPVVSSQSRLEFLYDRRVLRGGVSQREWDSTSLVGG